MTRLWSSLAIRLTAALIAFTFFVTTSLLAGIYLFGVRIPMEQVRTTVDAEARQLLAVNARQGEAGLRTALERRRIAPSAEKPFDTLLAADGTLLTGNLPSWPRARTGEWVNIEADLYRDGDEDDHEALSRDIILPDGQRLIVGRDVELMADRQELIVEAALWSVIAVLIFGLPAGLLISRISARRLAEVSGTARAVMGGDLTVRVPVKGTGDDFDQLGQTLNAMLDRNEELVASLGRVSDNIAHELRTPLARLRTALEELAEGDGTARQQQLMRASIDEAERIQLIFDALLRIARLDTGRHRLKRQQVMLNELVADAVELYLPEAEARQQALTMDLDPCTISCDRDLLFQAVVNLIDNALKFAPPSGRIGVRSRCSHSAASLIVKDSGPGVPEEYRPRLTERFFRAPETNAIPGSGLGLALANAIIATHDGELSFSGPAGAFEALVKLPRHENGGAPSRPAVPVPPVSAKN
jgi:signal transduction histidine kinase